MRLDVFVSMRLGPEYSRSQVARMIKAGLVTVNGAVARASSAVRSGDRIDVAAPPAGALYNPSNYKEGDAPDIPVIFADDEIIVVNKPAGMTVHPAPGHPAGTLVDALLARFPELAAMAEPDGVLRPGIVHRLDKDTSGVMVVARTPFSRAALSRQFKERIVTKIYLAIVKGKVARDRLTIERPVGRHPVERKRMSVRSHAPRDAVSHLTVIARFDPVSRGRNRSVVGAGKARHRPDASDSRASRVDWSSVPGRSLVWRQGGRRWIFSTAGAACAGSFDRASEVRRAARIHRTAASRLRRISRAEIIGGRCARASAMDPTCLMVFDTPPSLRPRWKLASLAACGRLRIWSGSWAIGKRAKKTKSFEARHAASLSE